MGLLGGWWGVAGVALVAIFLAREFAKYYLGHVVLTSRQKVVRLLGGLLLLAVAVMVVYSPVALPHEAGRSRLSQDARDLMYWGTCLALSVLMLLMAVMDAGEVSRQFVRAHKAIRKGSITREDAERILRAEARDHPDDVGTEGPRKR